jgi:hypothetical protein
MRGQSVPPSTCATILITDMPTRFDHNRVIQVYTLSHRCVYFSNILDLLCFLSARHAWALRLGCRTCQIYAPYCLPVHSYKAAGSAPNAYLHCREGGAGARKTRPVKILAQDPLHCMTRRSNRRLYVKGQHITGSRAINKKGSSVTWEGVPYFYLHRYLTFQTIYSLLLLRWHA